MDQTYAGNLVYSFRFRQINMNQRYKSMRESQNKHALMGWHRWEWAFLASIDVYLLNIHQQYPNIPTNLNNHLLLTSWQKHANDSTGCVLNWCCFIQLTYSLRKAFFPHSSWLICVQSTDCERKTTINSQVFPIGFDEYNYFKMIGGYFNAKLLKRVLLSAGCDIWW